MLKVKLSGYSQGTDLETPEAIAATFARISRDPRDIGCIRREVASNVAKTRKLNRNIIFGFGHASIAEHAQFNLDVIGVSRLAIEFLEHFRLCSFTERSQRYVRQVGENCVIPAELAQHFSLREEYKVFVREAEVVYERIRAVLCAYHGDSSAATARVIEWRAQEDARYVSLLCLTGQLGMTANARNLSLIVHRCSLSPLQEIQQLGSSIYDEVSKVAPSVIRRAARFLRDAPLQTELGEDRDEGVGSRGVVVVPGVRLLGSTPGADLRVATSLLYASGVGSWEGCSARVREMSLGAVTEFVGVALRRMEFYDAAPREFEHVSFSFELVVSASCYAQLKRHRMCTLTAQPYDICLHETVPPVIISAGVAEEYAEHARRSRIMYGKIRDTVWDDGVAEYALTNGARRRVLLTMNLRELYHFSRLRMDRHAQWDIRKIASDMVKEVKDKAPISGALLCGKDAFVQKGTLLYGEDWAVDKVRPKG